MIITTNMRFGETLQGNEATGQVLLSRISVSAQMQGIIIDIQKYVGTGFSIPACPPYFLSLDRRLD